MLYMDAGGLVARTNAEIRAAEAEHEGRKLERQRLRSRMAMVDELINDLEILNLRKATRVPLAYEPRLLQVRAVLSEAVPAELLNCLRTRVRPVKLMDGLYTIQDALFAQRHPEIPRELPEVRHGLDERADPGLFPAA